jgi:membrane-associated protease RseP (regulator of RpoE activity)
MRLRFALAICLVLTPALAYAEDPKPADKPVKYEIPYRLTDTKHVQVRVKINGKGPFNLILDTGAPALFLPKQVAKKAGIEVNDKGFGAIEKFEFEGGLKVDKVRAHVTDIFQVEGMNSLGVAGVELHGMIGYEVLARFKIQYDFTSDKLVFESLPGFTPPPPEKVGSKGGDDDIQAFGPLVKVISALLGIKPNFDIVPRGFVGIEFDDSNDAVVIKKVLPGTPAEKAGFKAGDKITEIKTAIIDNGKDLAKALAKAGVGTKLRFTIKRGDDIKEINIELGKGL